MTQTSLVEIFNCTPEQFFSIIVDYEKYSEFLRDTKRVQLIQSEGNEKIVEFQVALMFKKFTYQLKLVEKPNQELSWSLHSGELFNVSNGKWILEPVDQGTQARYEIEVDFKIPIPGGVLKKLINVNLPNMMKEYHRRVAALYS